MTSPQAATHSGWLTANLVFQLAFGLVAMTICLPSMQDWPTLFDAPQAGVQLTFSGFVVAYGGLQLLYGPLSDRIGRKPVLLGGLMLSFSASLLAALASDLTMLTVARVLQGAGSAAGMVVGRAMVQDLFTGPARTRAMAFVGMAMGVCPPLATLVGGQLHVQLGWRANFALMALFAACLFFAAWKWLPARRLGEQFGARPWTELFHGYARLVREPVFLVYVVMLASTTTTFYTFLGGAPMVLKGYGVTPEHVGWYIMCIPMSYIVGNMLTSRLVRRWHDRSIMLLGQCFTVFSLLLVLGLALAQVRTPLALSLPLVFLGIGHGLLAPPTLTGTVGLVPALAGSAAAVAGLVQQLMGATGGFLVGLVSHDGALALAWMMLGWTLLGAGAQVVLAWVAPRKQGPALHQP